MSCVLKIQIHHTQFMLNNFKFMNVAQNPAYQIYKPKSN